MKTPVLFAIAASLTAATVCAQDTDSVRTHIDILIEGRPDTKAALLMEAGADFRFDIISKAEFVDGRCAFDYTSDHTRKMEILFDDDLRNGSWMNKRFYAEGDTVICFADSDSVNISSQGCLQRMKDRQKAELDAATGGMQGHYLNVLNSCLEAGETESENYAEAYGKLLAIWSKQDTLRWDYLADGEPSLFGLFEMRDQLQAESSFKNVDEAMALLERSFSGRYGDFAWHPYYDECKQMFITRTLKPGRKYTADYRIHSVDGSEAMVGDLIGGRVAIIDLWASWCLPCRRRSIELIPIYEKYSPRGLAYVAVAREIGGADAMLKASDKDGYPWQSYIDIDDADGIWDKNGCPTAGGRIFVIDADGTIVGVDPRIEDVEAFLKLKFPDLD